MSNLPSHPPSESPAPLATLAEVRRDSSLQSPRSTSHEFLLQSWLAVRRYAWHIGLLTLTAIAITALLVYRIPKQYESIAVVRVDPETPDSVVTSGPGGGSAQGGSMDVLLATDIDEIMSPAVMKPALQKMGSPSGIASVSVTRGEGTYLLQIHVRALQPEIASGLANTLAQEFLDHEFSTRSDALRDLSGYMHAQVDELRARMEKSQLALNQFESVNNLADPEGKFNLNEQELTQLATELDQERAKQRELQSELDLTRGGNLNALLVSGRGDSLKELLDAQKQAEVDFTKLAAEYGPGNYLYQQAQRQLQQLSDLIGSQEKDVALQIQSETEQIGTQATATQKVYDAALQQMSASNAKEVQYNILKGEATSDQNLYNDLIQRLNAADVSMGYRSNALRVVDEARPNPSPVYPRPLYTLGLVTLLALALGCGGAIGIAGMDQTFTNPDAVRAAVGEAILASLPQLEEAGMESLLASEKKAGRRSLYAEAVLGLRTTLLLGGAGKARTLMMASAQPQEGKSTTAANLATAYAVLGLRTILIDADIRRPQVHRNFEIPNRVGLSLLLQRKIDAASCIFPSKIDKLYLMPAGPFAVNPTELLALNIGTVIEELKADFDCIIIDTPPLLDFADARTVAACVDSCVLVVRAGMTPRDLVVSAVQELRQVRARISGIVLNAVNAQMSHYYHNRGGYYRYGYGGKDYYTRQDEMEEIEGEAEPAERGISASAGGKSGEGA